MPGRSETRAFTLVELAIVLVIIGLIVGGVLVGQDMIRNAELQNIIRQEENLRASIQTFLGKYNGLPGDLKNATSFWGTAGGTGSDATCRDTDSTGSVATCNGNGNSVIDWSTLATVESHRFWQQLSNAGLISGNFSGKPASGTSAWSTDKNNAPVAKRNGMWWASNYNLASSSEGFIIPAYGNFLLLGAAYPGYGPGNPLLSAFDTWNIDVKADDGKPARGRIVAGFLAGAHNQCTTAVNLADLDADYRRDSSVTTIACKMAFLKAY